MKTILLLSVDELCRKNPCPMCLPHKGPRKQDASVILKESYLEIGVFSATSTKWLLFAGFQYQFSEAERKQYTPPGMIRNSEQIK